MTPDIEKSLHEYFLLQGEVSQMKTRSKELKQKISSLERSIKAYMESNHMTNLTTTMGEVILYGKKVAQTFKKETIIETLTEKLHNSKQAEELTDSIIQNKKFKIEDKIKVVLKN